MLTPRGTTGVVSVCLVACAGACLSANASPRELLFTWDFTGDSCLICEYSSWLAYASAVTISRWGDPGGPWWGGTDWDSGSSLSCTGSFYARSPVWDAPPSDCFVRVEGYISGLAGAVFIESGCPIGYVPDYGTIQSVGATVGVVFLNNDYVNTCIESSTQLIGGQLDDDPQSGIVRECDLVVVRVECESTSQVAWYVSNRCVAPFGNFVTGAIFDTGLQRWVFEHQVEFCPGDTNVSMRSIRAIDSNFDVDLDGRFNEFDVDALEQLLGSSTAGALEFDFNSNGVIDQDDVEVLDTLLVAGFSAGIVGDTNFDLQIDCDDIVSSSSVVGSVLGDSSYIISLDQNLDGLIELWEFQSSLRLWQPADVNLDGVVDIVDLLDFLDAFATCDGLSGPCFAIGGTVDADFNGDGLVDINDQLDFFDAYSSACP